MGVGIKEYLESKGLETISVGDNWNVDCPFCLDTRKRCGFKMSTGQWNCFNCEEKGSFRRFQKMMKDERLIEIKDEEPEKRKLAKVDQTLAKKYHSRLDKKGRDALAFLHQQRGFSQVTIDYFQLGSWLTKGHEYVSIPYWKDRKLVNMKFRTVQPGDKKFKWRRIKDGESCLFHDEVCDDPKLTEVFMCEAELDAIALWNAGFKNVISATTGAKKFQSEWYDRLHKFKRIYLVYDSDLDGQIGAEKMAVRLGMDRCHNILIPKEFKDANEYLWDVKNRKRRHQRSEFQALVKEAKRFEVQGTTSLQYAIREVYKDIYSNDEDVLVGLQTPWKKVNKIIRGAKPGQLWVVTAKPKVGKTTWVLNWMRGLGALDVQSGMFCCEMNYKQLAKKYIAMENKSFTTAEEMTGEQVAEALNRAPIKHIHFKGTQDVKGQFDLDHVCDWARSIVQRYGVKFICFDNLHFLVRAGGGEIKDKIGEVTRRFKMLAEELSIVFCLIVHPRKVDGIMTANDLKDSSSIYQDLDVLVILHRDVEQTTFDDVEVDGDEFDGTVQRTKYKSLTQVMVEGRDIEGGITTLYYQGERSLFFEKGTLFEKAVRQWKNQRKEKKKGKRNQRRNR